MMHRRHSLRLLVLGGAGLLAACSGGGTRVAAGGDTVLEVARSHRLNRFLQTVGKAGLTETLSGPGPFTVFAPTDRAFAAARLPGDPDALRAVIAYHVVPGTFTSDFLGGVDVNYTTLNGTSLNVDGTAGLQVNGANVVTADLVAGNGVVHVIDRVLAPR
jgi:uncharacterized surface protein with fasciclin (FAS1) repeats